VLHQRQRLALTIFAKGRQVKTKNDVSPAIPVMIDYIFIVNDLRDAGSLAAEAAFACFRSCRS